MTKRGWLYVVFGLVFYLLFLIIEMPAAWLAWGLNNYTHNTVRLDPLSGSLWRGTGQLAIYYPRATPHDLGKTEWSINPFWLLSGRIQVALQTNLPDRQIKTTLGIAKGRLSIQDTDALFSASFIGEIFPAATLIAPQGQIRLHTSELVFGQQNLEGNAMLEWQGAGSSLSNVRPLGDYRLDITGAGKTANLKLTTLRGALDLAGQGSWRTQTGQIEFNGTAAARERGAEIDPVLKILGSDSGNGKYILSVNTVIPELKLSAN